MKKKLHNYVDYGNEKRKKEINKVTEEPKKSLNWFMIIIVAIASLINIMVALKKGEDNAIKECMEKSDSMDAYIICILDHTDAMYTSDQRFTGAYKNAREN